MRQMRGREYGGERYKWDVIKSGVDGWMEDERD